MRGRLLVARLCASACLLLLCQCSALETETGAPPELLTHGRFRNLRVYHPPGTVRHLALLLSGDGGWTHGLGAIARGLSDGGSLVAGIDVRDLLAQYDAEVPGCVSPAAELADLGRYLQQRYHLARAAPVLLGHSAGATLVYVALTQASAGDFAGALTLSFCADLDLVRPLCPASALQFTPRPGGVRLLPAGALAAPWTALHGLDDAVCPAAEARAFTAAIPGAQFVPLPEVTHNYRHADRWWPQFAAAYARLTAESPTGRARDD